MKTLLVTLMIAATALAGACSSQSGDVAREKQQFQDTMEANLSDIDTRMNSLKDRIAYASEEERAELQEQMSTLDDKRHKLADSLAGLQDASADQWAVLKKDIESGYQDLKDGVGDLADRLDQQGPSVGQM